MKEEVLQIGRYGVVGVSAAVSYVGVALLLSKVIGTFGAAILAQVLSTAISYVGHRVFTFKSSALHRRAIPRFLVVTAAATVANVGVTWFASSILRMDAIVTSVMAVGGIVVVSFSLNRFWTFHAPSEIQAGK